MLRYLRRATLLALILAVGAPGPGRVLAEDQVFALEPEYVWGKNRKPRLGYRPPEVFDPLSDRLYQSGYRDYPPTAVPDELKQVDAMTRVEKMGRILACADGWFWPFSRTARKNEPAGIEIELLKTIAAKHGWQVDMAWVNMSTRFGPGAPGAAYDRSINKGVCDIVLGLTITGDDHHMPRNRLVFTRPFMSTGFVLVTQGPAKSVRTLEDARAMGIKVGVPAYSPVAEYAQAHGIPYTTFFQNYQVIDAMVRGEINAAMIWSGSISQARLEHPEAEFEMVKGYVPIPEMRWNSAWVVKEKEVQFKKFIDESFQQMLKSGEIKRIVERYGMPFYPPVEN
ncbi:MAG TPA: transporter substrate-binding domain-containing protein [Burkholderiales bacterium]|jgi:ABC-type amino acid transport substrate-binding protein|nr:transporter substrate-binding domain-containing protein [Burkholderiales bacterium]